jgi:hypothetical protein
MTSNVGLRFSELRPLKDDDPRHGTVNGYNNLYCRCQPCRDAWAKDHNEYMHRSGKARSREVLEVEWAQMRQASMQRHGTEYCYKLGC